METELYFTRNSQRFSPTSLIHEHVPASVRTGLYQVLEKCFCNGYIGASHLYANICTALGLKDNIILETGQGLSSERAVQEYIKYLLTKCENWQFYSICEIISRSIDPYRGYDQPTFSRELNGLFTDGNVAFRLRNHTIVKVENSTVVIQSKLREMVPFLAEAEFEAAREQLKKAVTAIDIQPEPGIEDCVKFTLAATESVYRAVSKGCDETGAPALNNMATTEFIPKNMRQAIKDLFDYGADLLRNNQAAGGISRIDTDEAEFVVAVAAAIILYLIKKRKALSCPAVT